MAHDPNHEPQPAADGRSDGDASEPLARLFTGPAHLGGRSRRRLPRRLVAGGAAAAVLLIGGAAVANVGSTDGAGYRTAQASTHTVDQLLDAVATVEPVSQAGVAFPVSGTVDAVEVEVGDTVATGQELASLDTQSLVVALDEEQAALDQAELLLEKALAGEDVSGLAAGGSRAGSGGSDAASASDATPTATGISYASGSTSASSAATTPTTAAAAAADADAAAARRAAQQAVLEAQQRVDADLAAAQQALDAATQVCAAVGQPADPTSTSTTTSSTSTTSTSTTSTTPSDVDDAGVAACRDALQAVLDAQQVVAGDQRALSAASTAYDALLEEQATAGSGSGTGTTSRPSGSGTGTAAGGTTGSGTTDGGTAGAGSGTTSGSGGSGSTATSPSAQELVAYQKAVDAAASQVAVASQAVDQAAIVSPISGTVAAVNLGVGDDVTGGSSTATIVVVGEGGYEVTTTVSVDDIGDVEVGQPVNVVPDGGDATGSVSGEVVGIGVAGTTSGSATTYPVTIGITGDGEGLGNGATASVSIVTDAAAEALAVPTSAVTTTGDRHTVTVLDGAETKQVTVEVGAVGDTWTEITKGLTSGQRVVLADLDEALPGSATDTSTSATSGQQFPGGGFPGGGTGGPPAGFGGARPGG